MRLSAAQLSALVGRARLAARSRSARDSRRRCSRDDCGTVNQRREMLATQRDACSNPAMTVAGRCASRRSRHAEGDADCRAGAATSGCVQIIKELQRHRFGRRAETLPEDQMLLGLEDVEQAAASGEAESEAAIAAERASRTAKRRDEPWIASPPHLPRIETVVDIEDKTCPCCGKALHRIGEDVERDGSTSCRHSSGCWSCAGPNTPAAPARTWWCRRRRRRG